jgi:csp2 family CRISPR-associated protein
MKNTLHALALTLAAFIIAACGDSQPSSDPAEFIKTYVNETLNGDVEKVIAMTYFSPELLKKQNLSENEIKEKMRAATKDMRAEMEKAKGFERVIIHEVSYNDDGDKARVSFTIKMQDGNSKQDAIPLIKIDGKWRAGE